MAAVKAAEVPHLDKEKRLSRMIMTVIQLEFMIDLSPQRDVLTVRSEDSAYAETAPTQGFGHCPMVFSNLLSSSGAGKLADMTL